MTLNFPTINTFHPQNRGKNGHTFHIVQPGVLPRRRNRKLRSALSNSDLQIVHAFRGRQASTSCLICDSASRDAEAELGNESSVDSSTIVDGKITKFDNDSFFTEQFSLIQQLQINCATYC